MHLVKDDIRQAGPAPAPPAPALGTAWVEHRPPLRLERACAAGDAVGAVEEAEATVMALETVFTRLPARPDGLVLRRLLSELRGNVTELRGRLTGVWPTPQRKEPKARRAAARVGAPSAKRRRGM